MFERLKLSFARRPTGRGKKASAPRYHAVSIILPSNACVAAKALIGKRFLAAQAPIFPVDGCDVTSCSCGYRHYDDRRAGPRRAQKISISNQRRTGDGRRAFLDQLDEDQRSDGGLEDEAPDYFIYLSTR